MLNLSSYIIPFIAALAVSLLLTWLIRKFSLKNKILDYPDQNQKRKIHNQPVPLLGGLAIYLSFLIVSLIFALASNRLFGGYFLPKHLAGILLGGFLLMIGGFWDDKKNLKPTKQIIWPILAALVVIGAGIGISYLNNPFGGTIYLDQIKIQLFSLGNTPYFLILWADLFAFIWLMGMMYTTKFLDGLDGLVGGITTIGAVVIFLLSLNQDVAQPETALLAAILAGSVLGFLVFNWHPAKIFLGEGGSLFCGFMLGSLAILSGAKIATALLIMGIPVLDVIWVIIRRLFMEKKSPFFGDKKHLHFRLLDAGLSQRGAVLLLYLLTIMFGISALILNGRGKFLSLLIMAAVMAILAVVLVLAYRRKKI
ncbi:undecaprenyl/decaprenyl-phosphate alpha-N-acetylglucosaminyl 1-phosphate transferase [Patescibacteria group bacterium]|nr:undecaprenyl/decaprenyl-phosphate alpha-N-acetylglucosaminyl 1-phosphate transferase [Patescibacteria group bacterium]